MIKKILIVGIILLVVVIIPLTIYLVSQQQNVSSNAQSTATVTPPASNTLAQVAATDTPTPTASCQPPGQVLNVKITYPLCQGQQCQFTQAGCSWDATPGAASYTVKITLVDTNTVISQTTLQAPTVTTSFNVTQGKTYRCDVTAVNTCGTAGATGTDSLLCQVDQVVTVTPRPTTVTPTPTSTIVTPTPTTILTTTTPVPSLPPTGNESLLKIGAGGVLITTFGGLLFLLSIL